MIKLPEVMFVFAASWVACYFDSRANRGAELNETGQTSDEAVGRYGWHFIGMGGNNCDELTR